MMEDELFSPFEGMLFKMIQSTTCHPHDAAMDDLVLNFFIQEAQSNSYRFD